jgi:hypothetical protein
VHDLPFVELGRTEGAARRGRDLDQLVELPAAAARGRKLRIGPAFQNYLTIPNIVANSDFIATLPRRLVEALRPQLPIKLLEPPLPQIKANRMRALAVLTAKRSALLPDVPTLSETVMPGFDLLAWAGLFGPANLPPGVVNKIAPQVHAALQTAEIKERFAKSGIEIYWSDPAAFKVFVAEELKKWTSMIKEAGIEPE